MRILLQSFETGFYLDTGGDWTNNSDLARNFQNTRQATEFKTHRRLVNAFAVVQPEPDPKIDVTSIYDETTIHAQERAN